MNKYSDEKDIKKKTKKIESTRRLCSQARRRDSLRAFGKIVLSLGVLYYCLKIIVANLKKQNKPDEKHQPPKPWGEESENRH